MSEAAFDLPPLTSSGEADAAPGHLAIGDIDASGGEGLTGEGGSGGDVLLLSRAGTVSVAGIDVSGGDSHGVADPEKAPDPPEGEPPLDFEHAVGADGGGAGIVVVQTGDLVGGEGTVKLGGSITATGGAGADVPPGDPEAVSGSDGVGGFVQIFAVRQEEVAVEPESPADPDVEIVDVRADIDIDTAALGGCDRVTHLHGPERRDAYPCLNGLWLATTRTSYLRLCL